MNIIIIIITAHYVPISHGNGRCFLQTRLSNTLNVSVDQETQSSIYFKTCNQAFEMLSRAFEILAEFLKHSTKLLRI